MCFCSVTKKKQRSTHPPIIMTNITATVLETLTSNSSGGWLIDIGANNSHESDTLSFIIAPLAAMSRHPKHHSVHPLVSPVTLSSEWSRLARLISLTILSVIGSVGNIFMISSVMIEDHLKKAGKQLEVEENLGSIRESCGNRLFPSIPPRSTQRRDRFSFETQFWIFSWDFVPLCWDVLHLPWWTALFSSNHLENNISTAFLGSSSAKAAIFLRKLFIACHEESRSKGTKREEEARRRLRKFLWNSWFMLSVNRFIFRIPSCSLSESSAAPKSASNQGKTWIIIESKLKLIALLTMSLKRDELKFIKKNFVNTLIVVDFVGYSWTSL